MGAPSGQTALANSQTAYYNTMVQEATTEFGKAQGLTDTLTAEFEPIFKAGPSQQGFSQEELNNLNTEAATVTGQSYANVSQALSAKIGGEGGGNEFVPQGANKEIQAQIATSAASQIAGEQSQILQSDYAQGYNSWLAAASGLGEAANVMGAGTGAANAATGAGSAASTTWSAVAAENSSWMNLAAAGLGGAASVGSSFCPAKGSLYLMADGSEQPVETLIVGDLTMGIDDDPQTIEVIQSSLTDIVQVITENGFITRNSPTHAFALPKGGFTVAAHSLGKTILTADGPSKVAWVLDGGQDWVFNIITNGSHTYRADGVWALGVGDAERRMGMNEWAQEVSNEQ